MVLPQRVLRQRKPGFARPQFQLHLILNTQSGAYEELAVVRGCAGEDAWGNAEKQQMYSDCSPEYSLNIFQFMSPALLMLEAGFLKLIDLDGFFLP